MKDKIVQFDYYRVFSKFIKNRKVETKEFDLNGLFEKLEKKTPLDTTSSYRDEKARIQTLKFDSEKKLWEIQFLRLRETSLPGIADDDGEFEIISLEDNKYVGEFASALYDPEKRIFILHRNKNSLTPSGLGDYLSSLFEDNTYSFELNPILSKDDAASALTNKNFKSFNIAVYVDDFLQEIPDKKSPLYSIMKGFSEYNSGYSKFTLSLGRKKSHKFNFLNKGITKDDLVMASKMKSVATLKTKVVPNITSNDMEASDVKVEEIDLLKNRLKDTHIFSVDKSDPLTHDKIYPILLGNYLSRRDTFKSV